MVAAGFKGDVKCGATRPSRRVVHFTQRMWLGVILPRRLGPALGEHPSVSHEHRAYRGVASGMPERKPRNCERTIHPSLVVHRAVELRPRHYDSSPESGCLLVASEPTSGPTTFRKSSGASNAR